MSSIAVAADSTQSEQHCERRKRKTSLERRRKRKETEPKKTKKGQRAEQKKTVKRKQAIKESSDDDSDLDFSKELKPIVGYLDDRKVMVDHLYRTISASKLRAMLPEIMKPLSTAELKQLCLEQLEVMSKKRIRRILEGDNADTISSSGTEDSGEDDKENKEEAPLNRSREGSPVVDSTYQTTWELREWEDQRNESLGLTTRQSGGSPRSRDVELEVESPAEEEGRYGGQEGRQRTHSYSSTDHSPILTLEVQDRSLYEELEDGELPSDDRHRCVGTVHNHPAASPVQQTLNDIPNSEPETIAVSSVQQTLNDIPISEPETIATNSNTLSATSESEANHKTLTATEESHGPPTSTKTSPVLSKTQREILELEMRARAIKAMLKAHEERKRRLALESKMMHSNPK